MTSSIVLRSDALLVTRAIGLLSATQLAYHVANVQFASAVDVEAKGFDTFALI